VNIKILACRIIGPAAAGSAGPVPTALMKRAMKRNSAKADWFKQYHARKKHVKTHVNMTFDP